MTSSTLILGGGFGGLACARRLRQLLPEGSEIVVVDRSRSFHVGAGKTWVMLGQRESERISRRREELLPTDVRLVEAAVERIDAGRGEVRTSRGPLRCDYLVVALGADLNLAAVPGLAGAAETFYTLPGAERLRALLPSFAGGDVVVLIPRTPFKCPPAPYEAAMLLHHAFQQRGVRARTRLAVYTVEPSPMPTAGPEMGRLICDELVRREIAYHPLRKAAGVDGPRRRIAFEDGAEVAYDLLIAVPPHEAPVVVREAGLTGESGWVPVDPLTLRATLAGRGTPVWAIGDVATVALPGRWKPEVPLSLPKAGVFAATQGEVVAAQIAAAVRGEPTTSVFDGKGFCYLETGDAMAMRGDGSFFERPHPVMQPGAIDAASFQGKLAWVDGWLGWS
jgi:sulfide:quinone oxidoreductase